MYHLETYKKDNNFYGYKIYQDSILKVEQAYAPNLEGYVDMTEKEATQTARENIIELEGEEDKKLLFKLKTQKLEELKIICQAKVEEGFTYNDKIFSLDERAEKNIMATNQLAIVCMSNPQMWQPLVWYTKDNSSEQEVFDSALKFIEFYTTAMQHAAVLMNKELFYETAIKEAETKEELDAIEVIL